MRFYDSLKFKKIIFVWKKLLEIEALVSSNIFHTNLLNFSENSNCLIKLLFNARGLKPGHMGIFDTLFLYLVIFMLQPINKKILGNIWSCDPSCKGPSYYSGVLMLVVQV